MNIDTFAGGRVELVKFRLPENSILVGMSVREVVSTLKCDVLICTVERGEDAYIAKADLVFDSEYMMEDGKTVPVLQIGVGQGILSFQNDLKSITVPASVDKIAKKAFAFCSELKTVNLTEGLESIGEMAFWSCKSLESISIPSTVTEIGTNAFAGCENLKSVTLPRAFESQIANIFEGCPSDMVVTYID